MIIFFSFIFHFSKMVLGENVIKVKMFPSPRITSIVAHGSLILVLGGYTFIYFKNYGNDDIRNQENYILRPRQCRYRKYFFILLIYQPLTDLYLFFFDGKLAELSVNFSRKYNF